MHSHRHLTGSDVEIVARQNGRTYTFTPDGVSPSGKYMRWGSFSANFWFTTRVSRTPRMTTRNAAASLLMRGCDSVEVRWVSDPDEVATDGRRVLVDGITYGTVVPWDSVSEEEMRAARARAAAPEAISRRKHRLVRFDILVGLHFVHLADLEVVE